MGAALTIDNQPTLSGGMLYVTGTALSDAGGDCTLVITINKNLVVGVGLGSVAADGNYNSWEVVVGPSLGSWVVAGSFVGVGLLVNANGITVATATVMGEIL